jgi:hypothetical protein
VERRLADYAARHSGLSRSSAAARLIDEGLRMDEHPGIVFRDGPTGRRAGLVRGPDVWEVIRAVRSARAAEPDLDEGDLLHLVAENSGLTRDVIRIAVDYWAGYPAEVDARIEAADRAEAERYKAWQRANSLLTR